MESILKRLTEKLLDLYGADYQCITVEDENGHYRVNVETEESPRLIGRSGRTLRALQSLLKISLNSETEENVFFTLDIDHYRKSQDTKLFERVQKNIDQMLEENAAEHQLWPMSAYKRRLVHLWIAKNFANIGTESVGTDRDRAILLFRK